MKWKPKSFWWKKKKPKKTKHKPFIGGLAQALGSNLKIHATTKDITDKPLSPWFKLQWSKELQKDEAAAQMTGRAPTASLSIFPLLPISCILSTCLKLSTHLEDFLNYGPGMNRLVAKMTQADSENWHQSLWIPVVFLFVFAFPSLHTSTCSPNLPYLTLNMLLSFQTSPASSFQHHWGYQCPG